MGESGDAPGLVPATDGLLGDLGCALRCWRADPRLPAFSLGLVAVGFVPSLLTALHPMLGGLGILLLPVSIFTIGFYGTQRIWYLRIFRGRRLESSEVWSMSWRFLGRYLVLGLMTAWPIFIVSAIWMISLVVGVMATYHVGQRPAAPTFQIGPFFMLVILVSLLWDFALTFATPALAYTTRSAGEAFRLGLRMIRDTWPAGALYVLFPPLALQIVSGIPGVAGVRALHPLYAATFLVSIFNLAAKGAVAAFYVRRVPVEDDGSLGASGQAPVLPAPNY